MVYDDLSYLFFFKFHFQVKTSAFTKEKSILKVEKKSTQSPYLGTLTLVYCLYSNRCA